MKPLRKCLRFWRLNRHEQWLTLQAAYWLCKAKFVIHCLPYRHLRPMLGQPMIETLETTDVLEHALTIKKAIYRAARVLPFHNQCLVLAICALKLCKRYQIPVTMYLGLAKEGSAKKLAAHAWVRCGSSIITGADERRTYNVTYMYSEGV